MSRNLPFTSFAFLLIAARAVLADPVPKLEGMQIDEAHAVATRAGFEVLEQAEPSPKRKGLVLVQVPSEGTDVLPPRRVFLRHSDGMVVPNLVGLTKTEAEATLGGLGVGVESSDRRHDNLVRGTVAGQVPVAGTKLDATSDIVFLDIVGGQYIKVPDVSGKPLADALKEVRGGELTTGESPTDSDFASNSTKSSRPDCTKVIRYTATATRSEPGAGTEVYPSSAVMVFYDTASEVVNDNICPPPEPQPTMCDRNPGPCY